MRIPDGNAFKLRIAGQIKTGEYVETADFSVVRNMIVNFVRRGREAQTSSVDGAGRIVVENDGSLARGVYGVELTGYYNGEPWRFYVKDVFQIVNENAESDEPTGVDNVPVYDVTVDVSFGGDGISAAFVEAAVNMHNSDENSHPHILGELSGKVDDVEVDGESVVETDPVTGKRIVGFRKNQFGKVDDVKVNGESVLNENNEAEITVPTKTSELDNDADFATNDDVDEKVAAHMVNEVKVSVDNTAPTGQPSAEKTFQDGVLDITFKNVKGEKGDPLTWNDLTDAQKASLKGAQGASAIFDPETGNILATLEPGIGTNDANAMTQKAVTEEITKEVENIELPTQKLAKYIMANGTWKNTTISAHSSITLDVTPGQIFKIVAPETGQLSFGFLTSEDTQADGSAANFAGGKTSLSWPEAGKTYILFTPSDAATLYIRLRAFSEDVRPQKLVVMKRLMDLVDENKAELSQSINNAISDINSLKEQTDVGTDKIAISSYTVRGVYINASGAAAASGIASNSSILIPVNAGEIYNIVGPDGSTPGRCSFLTSANLVAGDPVPYADGYTGFVSIPVNTKKRFVVPSNAQYMYIAIKTSSTDITPTSIWKVEKIGNVVENLISFDKEMEKKITEHVRQAGFSPYTTPSLNILHYTDIHADQEAANTILHYIEVLSDKINDVLCTGDSVLLLANEGDGQASWWTQNSGLADKSLFVLGNHDAATRNTTEHDVAEGSAWDGMGQEWCYNTLISPYISALGYVMPEGHATSHACYWHKDYADQKVRLIGLDCMHRFDGTLNPETGAIITNGMKNSDNSQELWLIDKLNETLDSNNAAYGYSVIICCHYPLDDFSGKNEEWNEETHKFDCNQNENGGYVVSSKTGEAANFHWPSSSLTLEKRFCMRNRVETSGVAYGYNKGETNNVGDIISLWKSNGGKFVAWLSGHTHMDYMYYPSKYPDLLVIDCDQAGCVRGTNTGDRKEGTPSRTCANFISIDTEAGLLKIVRIGYTMNRLLNSHELICYNYISKKVLNEK